MLVFEVVESSVDIAAPVEPLASAEFGVFDALVCVVASPFVLFEGLRWGGGAFFFLSFL